MFLLRNVTANIMKIQNDFSIEDIVYLKHDVEQRPRMVYAITITKSEIMYELISGIEASTHYGFELSTDKIIY